MNTKYCPKCEKDKSFCEFYKKGADYYQPYCKPCFNRYCQERWQQRKIEAIKTKGGKCNICGYNKNYAALDFHHRESENKDMQWNQARMASEKKMLSELDKCDLLCRNCHAELHNPQGEDF